MCNSNAGKTRYFYTGNQTGFLNYTGDYNFTSGGLPGSGLASSTTQPVFFPNTLNRRPWENADAVFNDNLLDVCYPNIEMNWIYDIIFGNGTHFRGSDKSLYVDDIDGASRFYDARAMNAPSINIDLGDWLSPTYKTSDLSIELNNRDGFFNDYLPGGQHFQQWSSAKVTIKVGIGEEYSNYFTIFDGQITVQEGLTTSRDTITVKSFGNLDIDEVPIPPNTFTTQLYPNLDPNILGNTIPLVYGDWTEDVNPWGNLPAVCINATDVSALVSTFKVSDLSLTSITGVYLHRGNRTATSSQGPVPFMVGSLNLDLANGEFSIPKSTNVFASEFLLADKLTAGDATTGSDNFLFAQDASVDFVDLGVQIGDRVLQISSNTYYNIVSVSTDELTIDGIMSAQDSFSIFSKKYTFVDGDALSVTCVGKNLQIISANSLTDINKLITNPQAISVSFDKSIWISDDSTQTIYNVNFNKQTLRSITYASLDPSITSVTGLAITNNNQLWVVDNTNSVLYYIDPVSGGVGFSMPTTGITGIGTTLANISDIAVQSNNQIWIVDQATANIYLIDNPASNPNNTPTVLRTLNKSTFASGATNILGLGYDEVTNELIVSDRTTNNYYRVNAVTGALVSTTSHTSFDPLANFITGAAVAPDGTLFFVDATQLNFYNFNDLSYCSTNPCFIARDLLQKFANHTYDEFDIGWNATAAQTQNLKCRTSITETTTLVTYIYTLLQQFSIILLLKFQNFSLFWLTFDNMTTSGKSVGEKDLADATFAPEKEINQYFNTITTTYAINPFDSGNTIKSDTYYSLNGISFAGKEVDNITYSTPNIYRRQDIDTLLPLVLRLAVPEPEFISATLGFRLIRTQIQDFYTVTFDDSLEAVPPIVPKSGRRYSQVPCMVRKISYNLTTMSIDIKLWSLIGTAFPGYVPVGQTVGGYKDPIVLTSAGRYGRISPTGVITGSTSSSVTLADYNAQDAQHRTLSDATLAWQMGYAVDLVNATDKSIIQTLTINTIVNGVVNFNETIAGAVTPTGFDSDGLMTTGAYLQYSAYASSTTTQKSNFAFFSFPTSNYPTNPTEELQEQNSGAQNFTDSGKPYVLYPQGFVPS